MGQLSNDDLERFKENLEAYNPDPSPNVADVVTIVESIYHSPRGEEATAIETRISRDLKHSEQLFKRRIEVGPEWVRVPVGWLDKPGVAGIVCIQNRRIPDGQLQPTPEEAKERAKTVVEASFDGVTAHAYILPGDSLRVLPVCYETLFVRCPSGSTRVFINVLPS